LCKHAESVARVTICVQTYQQLSKKYGKFAIEILLMGLWTSHGHMACVD
jgi:hypothetical protein